MEKRDFKIESIGRENLDRFIDFIEPGQAKKLINKPTLSALGLVSEGVACGAITGYVSTVGTFFITSLFVAEDYRRQGGATALVGAVSDVLLKAGMNPPLIRAVFCESGYGDGVIEFFDAIGEEEEVQEVYLLASLGSLYRVYDEEGAGDIHEALSFSDISDRDLGRFSDMAAKRNLEIPKGGFKGTSIDRGFSFVDLRGDRHIRGYMTADNMTEDRITISSLYLKDNDVESAARLFFTLCKKCRDMGLSGDTEVVYQTADHKNAGVVAGFFPDAGDILFTYDIMPMEKTLDIA